MMKFPTYEKIKNVPNHRPVGMPYLDLLIRGSQKIKQYSLNRFPSHGGFSIGKITHHLKQTQVIGAIF
jgi:hypothetical protein